MGGRRAKYKQPPPAPLPELKQDRPSSKKLGKRKADADDDLDSERAHTRPAKRAKEGSKVANQKAGKAGQKGDGRPGVKSQKGNKPPAQSNRKGKKREEEVEVELLETESGGENEGWEDMSDVEDGKAIVGDLSDLESGEEDDDLLQGPTEELDLGSDEEEEIELFPKKGTKSKQQKRCVRILAPPGSDDTSLEDDKDSEDEDERVTVANMEARSRALDEAAAHEAKLGLEEVQNAAAEEGDDDVDMEDDGEEGDGEPFRLPTAEEREEEKKGVTDVHVVQRRMRRCVRVLGSFKKLAEKGRSRSEYVEQLISDIASYFGYNQFLAEKLFQLFSVAEAIEFFEANEMSRPVTIRTNTLKTRRRDLAQVLINRGVNLEPIGKWTNVGLQVFESTVPIGATPEYLAGHYMLQAASSFLPVIALGPQPNERILDMASAPGGKTTHIAALLQNTGHVFANDTSKARTKSLAANVHRMGCKNVTVCSYDGREFPKVMGGFDRVLLDAPCSGTGVISKDSSVKVNKTDRDFMLLSHLQKQLILCAIDSVSPESKTGGYLVYSTCSVTVDENEAVVDYALKKRPNVTLVDTGIGFGREGFTKYRGKTFHPSVSLARRFYPHVHNMDGFFVAKFKIEKRAKVKSSGDEASTVTGDVVNTVIEEDVGFNSEEDQKYVEGLYMELIPLCPILTYSLSF
ncbi:NOL1/NOP2/sun family RNA met [Scleroderma citrinum]